MASMTHANVWFLLIFFSFALLIFMELCSVCIFANVVAFSVGIFLCCVYIILNRFQYTRTKTRVRVANSTTTNSILLICALNDCVNWIYVNNMLKIGAFQTLLDGNAYFPINNYTCMSLWCRCKTKKWQRHCHRVYVSTLQTLTLRWFADIKWCAVSANLEMRHIFNQTETLLLKLNSLESEGCVFLFAFVLNMNNIEWVSDENEWMFRVTSSVDWLFKRFHCTHNKFQLVNNPPKWIIQT